MEPLARRMEREAEVNDPRLKSEALQFATYAASTYGRFTAARRIFSAAMTSAGPASPQPMQEKVL